MYLPDQRVFETGTTRAGTVDHLEKGSVYVKWDDNPGVLAAEHEYVLVAVEDAPTPSAGDDPVHTAMLRHAHNAGAAVTALEIIRREAKQALNAEAGADIGTENAALVYIEKFADDVLSYVLPA